MVDKPGISVPVGIWKLFYINFIILLVNNGSLDSSLRTLNLKSPAELFIIVFNTDYSADPTQ